MTVIGIAFATASWASITSSENPSTDGSYTISWSAVPNAHSHQLYEDGALVHDGAGTSWSVSGKAAGTYKYTVGYCEFIFDEEMCFGTGYAALTVTVSPPSPTVSASFGKSSIALGESVTLTWSSTDATACSGSPSIGSTAKSGTKTYTPSKTGSFGVTVTCKGAGGSAKDSASVTVKPRPPTVSASFDKSSIELGDSVTLTWSSKNATACSGSPSISSTAKSGTKTYTPSRTGSLVVTVTCTGAGGSAKDSASVRVDPRPPTVSASFDKSSIALGDSVTLSWSSKNATACSGSPSIGSTAKSGTKTYTPSSTGSFKVTVTCTGAGGSADDSASVTVKAAPPPPPQPTVTASFDKSSITLGDDVTLTWSSTDAAACGGSPSIGSTRTSGTKTYTPSSAGIFRATVTCTGAGGSARDSDSVTVKPSAPTLTVPKTDMDGSYAASWTSVSGATSYELEEKTGSGSFANIYSGSGTSRNVTGKADGSYSYRVRACAGTGNCGDWSATATVRVARDLTASPNPSTDGSYTVSWSAILTAESYQLYESGKLVYDSTGTSWSFTGKAAGTYKYTLEFCELIFDEEFCDQPSGYAALTVTVTTPPSAPTLTVPSTDADGSYAVTWTSPSGATSYELEEKPAGGTFANIYSGSGTSRNIAGKADGTYSYRVRACGGACGDWSPTATVRVVSVARDLTASPNPSTDGSYTVSWSPILTAESYQLYENGKLVHDGAGTSWSFTGKAAGTYKYTLEYCELIFDEEFCDRQSGYAALTVTVTAPPSAPTLTVPATDADGSYAASWTASAGATSYRLEEKPAGGSFSNFYDGANRSHDVKGKTAGIYMYRVQACAGSDNCGDWSATGTTKVPPAAPMLTVPSTDADGGYDATWTSPPGATSYELREKVGSGMWSGSESLTATRKTYAGKAPGIYMYRVRACAGSDNCGDWSATGTTKVPPGPPKLTVPSTDADGGYDATWTSPSGATSYELREKVGSGMWSDSESLTALKKTYAGKAPGIYMYRVRACAGAGNCGGWSATGTTRVPPGPPKLTVPATDADGRYPISWRSVPGATSYKLEEKPAGGSFANLYSGSSTSTNIAGKADGTYSYRVRACAGSGNCGDWSSTESVAVSRTTQPPTTNNAPVAVDDAAQTPFGTAVEIAVLDNDTDADGDDLAVTAVTTPMYGTATITSDDDGNNTLVTYTPRSGHPGADTFDYTVSDGTDTATATVSVTVGLVKVTPNPSTTGSYTLSWQGTLLADRYRVLESGAPGDPPLLSYHLGTGVEYTGKATGDYHYLVERCETPLGQLEECVELGRETARVILPITPGNLPYRSGVTKGGDAYVNVPVAPAPGVNGLAPRLSIDYSGGRERHRSDQELPADMIGYGWRVGGFSTIRRCVKGTDDGDGISFDGTDALCLDGEPLTPINDKHLTGGAEYRTARESFAKIILVDNKSGDDWFEVQLPDGEVREYGNTADSQLWKPARQAIGTDPAEPAAAFLWSINKQTDAFGNVMTYEYHEDDTNLARHPKKIAYGDAEDATVEFVYKPRDDLDSTRLGSFFLGQPQRLTYIHLRLGGSLVRDYRLAYKTTSAGRVRLNALQTCGYEPSGAHHCLSPLEIGWTDAAGGTRVNALTDPMGAETTFAIATLSESGTHDFALDADDTPFGAASLPANTRALPAKNGVVKPVVTSVTRSDGIGGTRRTSYAYLGRGVESARNRGFLGFHAIRETDSASGVSTYTQYHLDHPFLGRPAAVVRYDGEYADNKTPLSKRAARYAEKPVSHAGSAATTTLPYAEETTEWLYEGASALGVVQTTETLTLPSRFVTKVVRETRAGHGATGDGDGGPDWGAGQSHTLSGVQRTTRRTLSFDNDATDWVLGFVDDVNVEHYGGDTSGTPDWIETVERTAIENTLAPDVVTRFPNDETESDDNSELDDDFEHQTDYDYDSRGNRERASETAAGSTRTWRVLGFSADRFPTSWKNPLNHTERATHHVGLGVPATTTDANNRRTSYAYDGLGREVSRTRHWDSATTTRDDGTKTTEDVKTTTAYASCDDGACGAVEATVADCGARYSVAPVMKVTTSAPDMPDSTAYLDMFGRAIRTSVEGFDGTDRRADVFHDALGRTVCESEPYHAGETAKYTRYAYDIRDRLTGVARPDGGATKVEHAAASNQVTATVTETVKGSKTTTRQTKRTRNLLGELVSTIEGAGEAASKQVKTSYAHDGAGRLKTVKTGGQTTTFAYDAAGNRASVTNPNLGAAVTAGDAKVSVKFKHNGYGELTERIDARGATFYGYDNLGRRTCAADRGGAATWEYDPANGTGLLKRRSYDRGAILVDASCAFGGEFRETYAYNADARLKTVTTSIIDDANATTTLRRGHTYDGYGRLSSTTWPSVAVGREYNGRGYLAKLKHGSTVLVEVTEQTARGQSGAVTYGNGVKTERTYDALGRLKGIATARGSAKIQDGAYAWRSDGSLERRTAGAAGDRGKREESFEYDYLNRLTGATTHLADSSTASRTLAFDYDPRGNLETKTDDASADGGVTGYDYETGTNRLSEAVIGGVKHEFEHDTSGHIEKYDACADDAKECAGAPDTFIGWNARGLAEKVTVGESKTDTTPTARDSFHYGPDGARYFRKSEWAVASGTATTMKTSRKYYAGAYEKTVTVGGGTVERVRVGDSVVHVRTRPASAAAAPWSAFEYAHRDHLGSLEAVTDARGNALIVLGHDPYGERRKPDWTGRLTRAEIESLLGEHGERVSRGFTGHEHLERTGLIHMNGRMYDPRLGRFLSPDPIVGDPTSGQSWNLYSYVGNNPLSYVDPTGLVQAGPCGSLYSGCMHFGGGAGGGAGTRTITVTTTVTVHGVMSVPYRYTLPVWTQVWDPTLDHYVWHVGDEYFWGERSQPFSYTYNVTHTVVLPDESVAEEPADLGGLGIAAADVGASILIPGYDLLRCNLEGDCGWSDWVLGIGEIAVAATGVGYGARVLAKAGSKAAKVASNASDGVTTVRHYTDAATKELISESGHLRPGTFVTRPGEISPRSGHLQIEKTLEIRTGHGTNYIDVEVPNSRLRVPENGTTTSGGAWQRQVIDEVSIDPARWRRPPGRPGN